MLNPVSPIQIAQFKREAKRLSQNTGITHSAALDEIARKHQHANWSLLMKHQEPVRTERAMPPSAPKPIANLAAVRAPAESSPTLRFFELTPEGVLQRMSLSQLNALLNRDIAANRPAGELRILQVLAERVGRKLVRLSSVTGLIIPLDEQGHTQMDRVVSEGMRARDEDIAVAQAGRVPERRPRRYEWTATPEQVAHIRAVLGL